MTKYLGYILAAVIALLALGVLWRAKSNEAVWNVERSQHVIAADAARHIQDSLYKANDSLKLVVTYHEQRVKELEQMKPPLVPNALKRNRWAGVERIGDGLTKKLP